MELTIFILITAIAAIANDNSRAELLALLFGAIVPQSLGLDKIVPEDEAQADGVYEICHPGYRSIRWLTGAQCRNLLAYGITVAHERFSTTAVAQATGRTYTAYRNGERLAAYQAKTKAAALALFRATFPGFPRNEIVWVRA